MCTLEGAGELRFFTGGNGSRLEVNRVMTDGEPAVPVVLAVSEQATAPEPTPDCLEGGAFVDVVLTADDDVASADAQIPPVCGAGHAVVEGRRPGVAPN